MRTVQRMLFFTNLNFRIFSAIVAGALVVAACCCRRRHVGEADQPGRPAEETCRCQAQANSVSFLFLLTHFLPFNPLQLCLLGENIYFNPSQLHVPNSHLNCMCICLLGMHSACRYRVPTPPWGWASPRGPRSPSQPWRRTRGPRSGCILWGSKSILTRWANGCNTLRDFPCNDYKFGADRYSQTLLAISCYCPFMLLYFIPFCIVHVPKFFKNISFKSNIKRRNISFHQTNLYFAS